MPDGATTNRQPLDDHGTTTAPWTPIGSDSADHRLTTASAQRGVGALSARSCPPECQDLRCRFPRAHPRRRHPGRLHRPRRRPHHQAPRRPDGFPAKTSAALAAGAEFKKGAALPLVRRRPRCSHARPLLVVESVVAIRTRGRSSTRPTARTLFPQPRPTPTIQRTTIARHLGSCQSGHSGSVAGELALHFWSRFWLDVSSSLCCAVVEPFRREVGERGHQLGRRPMTGPLRDVVA
jgi:hypothetical protein